MKHYRWCCAWIGRCVPDAEVLPEQSFPENAQLLMIGVRSFRA
jgi:hypothetical protein